MPAAFATRGEGNSAELMEQASATAHRASNAAATTMRRCRTIASRSRAVHAVALTAVFIAAELLAIVVTLIAPGSELGALRDRVALRAVVCARQRRRALRRADRAVRAPAARVRRLPRLGHAGGDDRGLRRDRQLGVSGNFLRRRAQLLGRRRWWCGSGLGRRAAHRRGRHGRGGHAAALSVRAAEPASASSRSCVCACRRCSRASARTSSSTA